MQMNSLPWGWTGPGMTRVSKNVFKTCESVSYQHTKVAKASLKVTPKTFSDSRDLGVPLEKVTANGQTVSFWSVWWKCSKIRLCQWLQNSVNILIMIKWASFLIWSIPQQAFKNASDRIYILKEVRIFQSNLANLLLEEVSSTIIFLKISPGQPMC